MSATSSRHQIDTTTRLDPEARQPPIRTIESVDVAEVASDGFPTERVEREPYRFTDPLAEAVNISIALGRPLLLQGDPGSGKTRLAHAVAYRLGLPLERAHIKSTTRAQDLLATFDAVGRLYDAQLGDKAPLDVAGRPRPDDPGNYVRLGPFGRAIVRAQYGRRSVLVIDEIDKADLDFPNDLLHELDRLELHVAETGATYRVPADRPDLRPIIVVTNNEEKALPSAFLRRCIYHELRLPEDETFLRQVLAAHEVKGVALPRKVVQILLALRELDLTRRPGLSELIDWAIYLQATGANAADAANLVALDALLKSPHDQRRARQRLVGG